MKIPFFGRTKPASEHQADVETITAEKARLEAEIAEAQGQIEPLSYAASLGDTAADKKLKDLQTQIATKTNRLAVLDSGRREAERRAKLAEEEERRLAQRRAKGEAQLLLGERYQAGAQVDEAIKALDAAYQNYRSLARQIHAKYSEGGASTALTHAQLFNRDRRQFRSAFWAQAPELAKILELKFESPIHRAPLANTSDKLPAFTDEMSELPDDEEPAAA